MKAQEYVMVRVMDKKDGKLKTLTIRRAQAERLGLIKTDKTVLDHIVEATSE